MILILKNLRFTRFLSLLICLISLTGCASTLALTHTGKKDLSVLQQGTNRSRVISEIGAPLSTAQQDGKNIDVYTFTQGYSKGNKVGRAIFHLAADFFTLFLWEVIATPSEIVFDGNEQSYKVIYDKNDAIEKVDVLKGKPLPYSYPDVVQLPVQTAASTPVPSVSEKIVSAAKPENLSASAPVSGNDTVTGPSSSGNVTTVTVPSQPVSSIKK